MDVLRFVALIGALVFVHEFGHFVVAKVLGVTVLKFSLGFGPRVVGFRGRETDYCLSLLPFGGFVKLLGEDPGEPVGREQLAHAFHSQSLVSRSAIVLAGPLMSLAFPVLLYFIVMLGQTTMTPPRIGTVVSGHPADGRLLPGDRVLTIDGRPVASFQEIRERIATSPGRSLRFTVERGARVVDTVVTPASVTVERPLDAVQIVGRAGISAAFALSVIAVRTGDSPALRSGLRTFDLITSYAGRPIVRWMDLERALQANRGVTVPVSYLRPQPVLGALGGLCDLEVQQAGLVMFTPTPGDGDISTRTGIESPDLYVADLPVDSAEYEMGLRRGDKILLIDGVPPASFESMRESLLAGGGRLHTVSFRHEGREVAGAFELRAVRWSDEFGNQFSRVLFRTDHWVPSVVEDPIPHPSPVLYALVHATKQTGEAIVFVGLYVVRLFQGRVSVSSVGGIVTIYDASRSNASSGLEGFLWLMALVSVNLGLLNLLPIPTLDGGHLAFFALEAAVGRSVSIRARRIASVIGLVFVVIVTAIGLRNDLWRKFGNPRRAPVMVTEP